MGLLPLGRISYPGGFSKLRIDDEDTQRMARGEDNVGSSVDEGPSSTSYEDLPLRVDATGVITWPIPVGEPRTDKFLKIFSFPPNIWVPFSSLRPRFADYTKEDLGRMNFIYWPEIHISEGLRFPFPPLVHRFFNFTRLHLIHTHVNIIRVLLGVCVLNRKYEMRFDCGLYSLNNVLVDGNSISLSSCAGNLEPNLFLNLLEHLLASSNSSFDVESSPSLT